MRTGVRVYPSSALVEASCHRFKRKPLSAVAGSWAVPFVELSARRAGGARSSEEFLSLGCLYHHIFFF